MASLGNPRSWIPYMDSKECSQGLCSLHCPQWCYIVYPPPPPLEYADDDDSRPNNFSPLVIAIIGILATAFLLVSYYAVISKYCGRRENHDYPNDDDELQEDHMPSSLLHVSTVGLDESLIKSITVCKYKRGDGLVQVTDCSVCLSEFEDDESVRLLPKCSHAFHLPCIDTWLKSHSTCPLCRATIFTFNASPPPQVLPAMAMELPSRGERSSENGNVAVGSGNENGAVEVQEEESSHETPTTPPPPPPPPPTTTTSTSTTTAASKHSLRAFSDLGNMQGRHRIIEIRDIDEQVYESIGRSISMDHSFQSGASVAHHVVHMMNQLEQHSQAEGIGCSNSSNEAAGPSKRASSYKRKVLHCVLSPIAMKRSFASGRFSLSTSDRARQGIIPVAV